MKLRPNRMQELFTRRFLLECGKAGYTRVAIGLPSPLVPDSVHWGSFMHTCIVAYNHKVDSYHQPQVDVWPAIWRLTDTDVLHHACGNSHQVQMTKGMELLTKGVYVRTLPKVWRKVKED
jgi:hypothetical protein